MLMNKKSQFVELALWKGGIKNMKIRMRRPFENFDGFPRISSDLHNEREFISCAVELVETLEQHEMRYDEAETLLEEVLHFIYQHGKENHGDMQLYAVKHHINELKSNG